MSDFWEPLGMVFEPPTHLAWCRSHAMLPTPLLQDPINNVWRIFFSGRDNQNRSSISFFDVQATDSELTIIKVAESPVLTPGRLGTFDDNGVSPSCVIENQEGVCLLYYIGWNPGSTTRVNLFGGLARQIGNNRFMRIMESPLLERIPTDPFINTAPWVVKDGAGFTMFYVSGTGWKNRDFPFYNIKLARSKDGVSWSRDGTVALDFISKRETALARPFVIKDKNIWRMWFSKRVGDYSIGYAESFDGTLWIRRDELYGLEPMNRPGEDKMVEYGVVITSPNKNWLLYNGNDYGRNGIFHARGPKFDS